MSTAAPTQLKSPKAWLITAAFILVVVAVGAIIGTQTAPGSWYDSLNKPPFNPPNWLFGPVWFALYVLIGVAGARIFVIDRNSTAMKIWFGQMALNWIWSPVWFGLQLIWPAFAVISLILILIVTFIVSTWRLDRVAACLFMPYLAWVGFATLLNLSIGLLN